MDGGVEGHGYLALRSGPWSLLTGLTWALAQDRKRGNHVPLDCRGGESNGKRDS